MTYQKKTGPLMANTHPGSYSGQDAYTDMFITEENDELGRNRHLADLDRKQCGGGQRMPDKSNFNAIIKEEKMDTIVRRLTPLECERLQGFPDGWTDIGEWTDTKGKVHKESSDSARYKALGNSIAVGYANERRGFWMWLMKRISAQYERTATLGSLFDGIGGFPLAWETYNGKGSARWASEIEEFPIAVTKFHFGED